MNNEYYVTTYIRYNILKAGECKEYYEDPWIFGDESLPPGFPPWPQPGPAEGEPLKSL